MTAVIGEKNHNGVIIQLQFFEGRLYRPNAVIHALNHPRISRILVPAHWSFLLILCLQFRFGLNRCMHRVMGEV